MSIKKGRIYSKVIVEKSKVKYNIVLALEDEVVITWDNASNYSSADEIIAVLENEKISYAWIHDLKLLG